MAYLKNWALHTFAILTNHAYSDTLAQDFWGEPLFKPESKPRYHWLKLTWVYWMSGVVQFLPVFAVGYLLYGAYLGRHEDWKVLGFFLGLFFVSLLPVGAALAAAYLLDLRREKKPAPDKQPD